MVDHSVPSIEHYTKGTLVLVPVDGEEVFLPHIVTEVKENSVVVQPEDGQGNERELTSLPPLQNPKNLEACDDLTNLSFLHEPAVLQGVKLRYARRFIYTYSGIVLIAVNPFQQLPIYTRDTLDEYVGRQLGELSPHIFAIAEDAFTAMKRDNWNQSVIVSGESGAGKTESAKHLMRYLATVCSLGEEDALELASDASLTDAALQGDKFSIERQVLASNPVLEAFGNAKTLRNDNSSRFGKYIELQFSDTDRLAGASIRTYLLEKSRVTFQAEGERSYHFFYQLCAGASDEERARYHIGRHLDYAYLRNSTCSTVAGLDDSKEYKITRQAMKMVGIADEVQEAIVRTVAGVLLLGNVEIIAHATNEDASQVVENEALAHAAEVLGVDQAGLVKWLTNRMVRAAREQYEVPIKAGDAKALRDALAKTIYHRLFLWLVERINESISNSAGSSKFIGILDIYGFESFKVNSFEQLCINYANEALQNQFNRHVFKLEQEEYIREGIPWQNIDFGDNQPAIDLIEKKMGILDLLDEECRMPKGSDASYAEKLYGNHTGHPNFAKPRMSNVQFTFKHYAGEVTYSVDGFLDKNKDQVADEVLGLFRASGVSLVKTLFTKSPVDAAPTGSKKINSAGSQFKESLGQLMETLYKTAPHYVRCIKPNQAKKPLVFEARDVLHQLRCGGVLETIRISLAGYPTRWTYAAFHARYKMLAPNIVLRPDSIDALKAEARRILSCAITGEDRYQFGKTKLFFRAGQVALIERLRTEALHRAATRIAKDVRRWRAQRRYRAVRGAAVAIQSLARGRAARCLASTMRRNRAATRIRAAFLGHRDRTRYLRRRAATCTLQRVARGRAARKLYRHMREERLALLLGKTWRMHAARKRYRETMRKIVVTQSAWRRRVARRELKKLRIEARSLDGVKEQSTKLAMKVIELQQLLSQALKERDEARKECERLQGEMAKKEERAAKVHLRTEREQEATSSKQEAASEALTQQNQELQADLKKLKKELKTLQQERDGLARDKESLIKDKESLARERDVLRRQGGGGGGGGGGAGGAGGAGGGGGSQHRGVVAASFAMGTPRHQQASGVQSASTPPGVHDTHGDEEHPQDGAITLTPTRQASGGAARRQLDATEAMGGGVRAPAVVREPVARVGLVGVPVSSERDEERLLAACMRNLKPQNVGFTPAPAVLLFQACLFQAERGQSSLIASAAKSLRALAQKLQTGDRGIMAYWLGYTCMFLHLLRRDKNLVDPESLHEPNLTESAMIIYQAIMRGVKHELLAMLVTALLQSTSNLGLVPEQPRKGVTATIAGLLHRAATVKDVTKLLSDLLVSLQRNGVSPSITNQLFSELFYFISSHAFNKMLLRRDLCSWERAMQIKFNVSQLEQWVINSGLGEALGDRFAHLRQAVALLLLNNKVINDDVSIVYSVAPALSAPQLKQLLSIYTAGEFETALDTSLIATITTPQDNNRPSTLLLDATLTFGFRPFPPTMAQEDVEYEQLVNNRAAIVELAKSADMDLSQYATGPATQQQQVAQAGQGAEAAAADPVAE